MASLDRRLNPLYAIKECSSCGNLHTKDCGCSKGSLEDKILVPVPDSSQRPLKIEKICLDCGDPVHGLYCRQCALIRKTLEEVFQDFQDTSKSSDDDTNFVNQEPFVVKQGPGVNSSQSPPQINHNCCYECGDSLDDIFCQRCTSYGANDIPELRWSNYAKRYEKGSGIAGRASDILQQRRTKEFIVPNFFADHPTLHLDLDLILFSEPLFAYIEWIFLPFLTYPVAPPYLLSCGNEDTIFDLGISVYHSFMTGVSHRSGTFIKFNVYPNHLNESPMEILSSTCSHGLLNSVGSESCL
ncbi:hypothetical protein Tco_0691450 [Tanacetum coccineum]